jgi:hypothetical protein
MGSRAPRSPGRGTPSPWVFVGVAAVLLAVVLVGLRLIPASPLAATAAPPRWETSSPTASDTGSPTPPPVTRSPVPSSSPSLLPLAVRPANVKVDTTGWWSWAMIDQRTGKTYGSANMGQTSTTASLIKAWIAADFLRRSAESGQTPSDARMAQVSVMIRDSDNTAAESLYNALGRSASIKRLLAICKLADSSASTDGGWSRTRLSARDTARMGMCIADGRAAGAKWTRWLLNEMRQVRGEGNFGIRKAFPVEVQKTIAIKNGWIDRTAEQEYHVSCLAIGDGWTVGVMTRYRIGLGYSHGAEICESVGRQLRAG